MPCPPHMHMSSSAWKLLSIYPSPHCSSVTCFIVSLDTIIYQLLLFLTNDMFINPFFSNKDGFSNVREEYIQSVGYSIQYTCILTKYVPPSATFLPAVQIVAIRMFSHSSCLGSGSFSYTYVYKSRSYASYVASRSQAFSDSRAWLRKARSYIEEMVLYLGVSGRKRLELNCFLAT